MLRKTLCATALALAVTACADHSTVAPAASATDASFAVAQASASLFGSDAVSADAPFAGLDRMWGLWQLPDSLALSAEQQATITSLVAAFRDQAAPLVAQLDSIRAKAVAARRTGASTANVRVMLAAGADVHVQLQAALDTLKQAITNALTPAQAAWVLAHEPGACDPQAAPPLTDAQRTQLQALVTAFQQANAADIATVRAAHLAADSAYHAGASASEIQAIVDAARPALDRLRAAQLTLQQQITAVLGTDQRPATCRRRRGG